MLTALSGTGAPVEACTSEWECMRVRASGSSCECVRASARASAHASERVRDDGEGVCVCVCARGVLCVRSVLTDTILKRATNAESVRTSSHRHARTAQHATHAQDATCHPTYNRQHAPASAQQGLPLSAP